MTIESDSLDDSDFNSAHPLCQPKAKVQKVKLYQNLLPQPLKAPQENQEEEGRGSHFES